MSNYNTLFLDIGGVILTNGWDRNSRKKAADKFNIDWQEFEKLHPQYYDTYEKDEMTLREYLDKVVFWKKRDFTPEQFIEFIYNESQPYPEMLALIKEVKTKYHLRVVAVSNEGREVAEYRIKTFNLTSIIDDFIISCFVHCQKPDPRIYQTALDVAQVQKNQVIYIDDRANLIEAGRKFGLTSIQQTSYATTKEELQRLLK